jgi:CO dehydrogenase maturation factor
VKVAVTGKGGVGKTTVAGTVARIAARSGRAVLAIDADANPMLGISLGVPPAETDRLVAVRQALDEGTLAHQPSVEELVATFGADAPDGVRLVVCNRIDTADPG